MSFNVRTLAISKTGTVPLRDASGARQLGEGRTPLTITVHSPGTRAFNAAKHKRDQRSADRMMNRMQGKPDGVISAEDSILERAEFLADITISFDGFGIDGLSGREAFLAVYGDLELGHIADDVEKFVNDRANFTQPSTRG